VGSASTTFVGKTPLGGVGGCYFQVMTVLGFLAMGMTMLKISARSDSGKCFISTVEPSVGNPLNAIPHSTPAVFQLGIEIGPVRGTDYVGSPNLGSTIPKLSLT